VFDLSILKIAVLGVLAVLVFGPDKLPKMVGDVMRFVRAAQDFARSSTAELTRELPPELKDLDLADLRPKAVAGRFITSVVDDLGQPAGPGQGGPTATSTHLQSHEGGDASAAASGAGQREETAVRGPLPEPGPLRGSAGAAQSPSAPI
jgi:sec-independent protein translocase protein TatB